MSFVARNAGADDRTEPGKASVEKTSLCSSKATRLVAGTSTFVCVLALLVLLGWLLDIRTLKNLLPTLTTMKANTALCLGLLGIAVWLSKTTTSYRRYLPAIWLLAGTVFVIAGIVECEYIFSWNAGIDQLIFQDKEHQFTSYPPGRLAPATGICFLLLANAVLLLDRRPRISHGFVIAAMLVASIGLIGYLYNLPTLYGAAHYTSMALHTVFGFLALCIGIMACRPDRGLTALLLRSAQKPGSYAQFLLPGSVVTPIVVGYVVLNLQRLAAYGPEFTLALFSVLLIVLSATLVWTTENERQKTQARESHIAESLAESEERLRLAVDSAAIGIWSSNVLTGEMDWDLRCRNIFGFQPDTELTPEIFRSCIHPEDKDVMQAKVEAYRESGGQSCLELEYRIFRWNDASLRYVYSRGQTIFESIGPEVGSTSRRAVASRGTLQDVTTLKLVEHDLRRINHELEQFAYAAAHDLQEPLRNVCLATQILASQYKGRLDKDADNLLQVAVDNPLRMQAMVKDLLAYSRALSVEGGMAVHADSNAALAGALANLQLAIHEKQAQITYGILPPVRMREIHLVQIFQNLIGNSLKYCAGQRPIVEIQAAIHGGLCTFVVSDNGEGIPPEYRDRVFLVFKRLHSNRQPGTGIGLALCKRIVEYYDGKIWIESQPQGCPGSKFFFTASLAKGGRAEQEPEMRATVPELTLLSKTNLMPTD